MSKSAKDKGICEHCAQLINVEEYGVRTPCPNCGKINIFQPDIVLPIRTPFGSIQVGMPPAFIEAIGESVARNLILMGASPDSIALIGRGLIGAVRDAFFSREK
ncbi:MAG: hypothetical protein WC831_02745 [Parcubacteria group bacterium]